ncbi:MAG TPA: caspase family protein [Thermoanaerobaculia bacterium]|nr:caspase family protein [Thermoanaerobaculia bacterium]
MKKRWILAAAIAAIATATFVPMYRASRSAGPHVSPLMATTTNAPFDPKQSAALFVGVRKFTSKTLDVPYAVDDAVDLAYKFSVENKLVQPERVVLAISGKPQKESSQQRLAELHLLGVTVTKAGHSDIIGQLEKQAARAGRDGMVIASFSTHGYVRNGTPYIFGATSLYEHEETAASTMQLFDIIAQSDAARSLVFVDACRERVTSGKRAGTADPATAAPALVRRMSRTNGQVVLYAAAAGKWAYDDESGNGVFTKAVLDALNCDASAPGGIVTVKSLHRYVERSVRKWILRNRRELVNPATQISVDGDAGNMPLCVCWNGSAPTFGPSRVAHNGRFVTALGDDGKVVWRRDAGEEVVETSFGDRREVIVRTRNALIAYDATGKQIWSADEGIPLRDFAVGDLFRKHRLQVVALWDTRLTIYDAEGKKLAAYDHAGSLQHLAIGRPTNYFAPRIVVAGGDEVLVFDPKKVAAGKPLWRAVTRERIEGVAIVDHNHDARDEIALTTRGGTVYFDIVPRKK